MCEESTPTTTARALEGQTDGPTMAAILLPEELDDYRYTLRMRDGQRKPRGVLDTAQSLTRAKVYFVTKRKTTNAVVRILDWGFRGNANRPTTTINLPDVNELVPGHYWNLVGSGNANARPGYPQPEPLPPDDLDESGDMNGTAQFWDTRAYNNQPLNDSGGTYVVQMYVDGSPTQDTLERGADLGKTTSLSLSRVV